MAGIMRKGMSWLGLGPEDDYDDFDYEYDGYDDEEPVVDITGDSPRASNNEPAVRAVPASDADDEVDDQIPVGRSTPSDHQRPRAMPQQPQAEAVRPRGVVRPLTTKSAATPMEVSPDSFNEAQEIGDLFRNRTPVVMNVQGLDRDLARRLLDFASGVSYGLGGSVQKVRSKVYLLTPPNVDVSPEDMRRLKGEDDEP